MVQWKMDSPADDSELVTNCANGQKEAWDLFVRRYSKLVYHSIHKTLRSYVQEVPEEDIEDVYNSIFLSFLENDSRKLRQFEGKQGCSLASWIGVIAIRKTIDFLRKRREHMSLNDDSDDDQPLVESVPDTRESFEGQLESAQCKTAVAEAIRTLQPGDRLFMKLFYEKGCSPEEIADIMNISVNTVYSRKNRIREKIKIILIDSGAIARNPDKLRLLKQEKTRGREREDNGRT